MSLKELARATDINYSVVSSVLSGKVIRKTVKEKICDFLGIKGV